MQLLQLVRRWFLTSAGTSKKTLGYVLLIDCANVIVYKVLAINCLLHSN